MESLLASQKESGLNTLDNKAAIQAASTGQERAKGNLIEN